MRVWLVLVGAFGDRDRGDPVADIDRLAHSSSAAHELLEPAFQSQAVVQDEIGLLRPHDVAGGRLVVVDLGADLGDRLDDQLIPGDFSAMSAMTVKVASTRLVPGAPSAGGCIRGRALTTHQRHTRSGSKASIIYPSVLRDPNIYSLQNQILGIPKLSMGNHNTDLGMPK